MALALAAPLAAQPAAGKAEQGRLMVHPTRLVLDDARPSSRLDQKAFLQNRGRSGEVLLVNGGSERCTYRVSLVNMAMGVDGVVREVPKQPGEITAENLVRYSPKQVTLEPNGTQTVRIQVRLPEGLPPGEYRSHLMFRAVPPPPPPVAETPQADAEAQGFSVKLTPIYGLTIPLIIRHGATQASTTISDLRLEPPSKPDDPAVLHLRVNRKGNRSVYGDLEVTWSPRAGLPRFVGKHNGIAIYDKVPHRDMTLGLQLPLAKDRGPGSLKIRYLDHESKLVLAEATLEI
jgi:hypothetical protein